MKIDELIKKLNTDFVKMYKGTYVTICVNGVLIENVDIIGDEQGIIWVKDTLNCKVFQIQRDKVDFVKMRSEFFEQALKQRDKIDSKR